MVYNNTTLCQIFLQLAVGDFAIGSVQTKTKLFVICLNAKEN
jgi:hypothetical protein